MKLKIFLTIIIAAVAMLLIPVIVVNVAFAGDALGILFLLMTVLNPIVSVGIGIASGWSKKIEWYLPLITAVIYLLSETIISGFDISYFLIAGIYFAIGIAAAFITKAIKIKKSK